MEGGKDDDTRHSVGKGSAEQFVLDTAYQVNNKSSSKLAKSGKRIQENGQRKTTSGCLYSRDHTSRASEEQLKSGLMKRRV